MNQKEKPKTYEAAVRRISEACFSVLRSLDGEVLNGGEYHKVLRENTDPDFEHLCHWLLMAKHISYDARIGYNGKGTVDISRISKRSEPKDGELERAMEKYREYICARIAEAENN